MLCAQSFPNSLLLLHEIIKYLFSYPHKIWILCFAKLSATPHSYWIWHSIKKKTSPDTLTKIQLLYSKKIDLRKIEDNTQSFKGLSSLIIYFLLISFTFCCLLLSFRLGYWLFRCLLVSEKYFAFFCGRKRKLYCSMTQMSATRARQVQLVT